MKEVPIDLHTAVAKVKNGDTLLQGGFGMTGNPVQFNACTGRDRTKHLTFIGKHYR